MNKTQNFQHNPKHNSARSLISASMIIFLPFLRNSYHFIIIWCLLFTEITGLVFANRFYNLSFELFVIWIVLFAAFVIITLVFKFIPKMNVFYLFFLHGILYLSVLINVLPDLFLENGFYLLIGYWSQFIIDSLPKKDSHRILSEVGITINNSLFVILLIVLKSPTFGLFCSVLILLMHVFVTFINKNNKSSKEKEIPQTEPWKQILTSMFSGIFFILKVKPDIITTNVYDKGTFATQERGTILPEKYFELLMVNDKGLESNLINLKDCLEFGLRDFKVSKILQQDKITKFIKGAHDLNENEHDKKLLSSNKDLDNEQNKSFCIFKFLNGCLLSAFKSKKNRRFSAFLGVDSMSEKLLCNGSFKNNNYLLTITKMEENNSSYILFDFAERNADCPPAKEVYNFKDQMLANVAHDLRSPINGILSFIDLSIEAKEEKERLKNLQYAKISGNLLLNLVSDILDFSVIRDGKLNVQVKPFQLKELVNEVVNLMRLQAEMKQLQIKIENNMDPMFILQSDRRRLSQLLINLLGNSIKFTSKGYIKLKICKTCFRNVIKFEIKDTGVGIKPEILPQLFKPFATFDTETGLNKYGIGLGLNICKMIVSLLGPCDSLFVSSVYHKGTKFGFLLFTNIKEKTLANRLGCDQNVIFKEYNSYGIFNSLQRRKRMRNSTLLNGNNFDYAESLPCKEFLKRRISTLNIILKDPVFILPPYKQEEVVEDLPMEKKLNPTDYFSNYNRESSLSMLGDEFLAMSDLVSQPFQKNKRNNEISSLIGKTVRSNTINSKIQDPMKEFQENESPIQSMSSKQLTTNCKSFMKTHSNSYQNLTGKRPPEKKKMISTQDVSLVIENKIEVINKNITLLLVDDNPFNLLILSEYLKKLKEYSITSYNAYNGSQAMDIFHSLNQPSSKSPISMVLMDCQMPILDGYETAKQMRGLMEEKNYSPVFIIAITAFQDEGKCLEAGMNSFLMKPVNEKDFLAAIRLWSSSDNEG